MPELSLEFIGRKLLDMQVELRAMRSSMDRMSARFDTIKMRMDTLEAVVEAKLDQMTVLIDMGFDKLVELIKAR
jgi:hypothetical protein